MSTLRLSIYAIILGLGVWVVYLLRSQAGEISDKSREILTLRSQLSSKSVVKERIIREPGGRIIEEREKVVERTKVIKESSDKSHVKTEIKETQHARYSLGVQFRPLDRGRLHDMAGILSSPILEVGANAGGNRGGPLWFVTSYDFGTKEAAIGFRLDL